jgi:hypothetical protein
MIPKALGCVWLLALLAFLPACSQKNAIIGYWQLGDAQAFWEFRKDGVYMTHGEVPSKVTGRYTLSRDKLKIQFVGSPEPRIVSVSIKGDAMTLTENNITLRLHRVDPSQVKPEGADEEQLLRYLEQRTGTNANPSRR